MTHEHPPASADPEEAAAALINDVLEREGHAERGAAEMKRAIEERAEEVTSAVREQVSRYIDGVMPATEQMKVKKLERGIGGLYNGSTQHIAVSTLAVRDSIQETIENTKEVAAHERYHADHKHLEALQTVGKDGGGAVLRMGGREYDETALIEGLTVSRTGEEFVSDEYRKYKADLHAGMHSAGIGIETLEAAVNEEKDLRMIDDRTRARAETPRAVAI